MPDKIKEILDKVLAWWNKFTAKQKTLIIGVSAAVIFTFVLVIYIFSRPQYIQWQRCSTTAEAAEVIAILDNNSIGYKVSTDGLNISVRTSQLSTANLALGAAGYVPDQYSLEKALSGGLGTTQSDRQKQYQKYLEQKFANDICSIEAVKSATVSLNLPDSTGLLIDSGEEASAWIQLTLRDKLSSDQAATIARAVATALGNSSTAKITIVDSNANLLFSGEEDYSTAGIANSMFELRTQAEVMLVADVKKVLVGSKQFDDVEVACNLDIDYAEYQKTIHEYWIPNGATDDGLAVHEEEYSDSNTSGVSGLPGTDSNNENTYQFSTGTDSESSSNQHIWDRVVNESITVQDAAAGAINYSNSSLALTAIRYRTVREEDVRNQGLLSGMSWSEYKAANDVYTRLEVDDDFYSLVANATGISQDRITIIAYEKPQFIDRAGLSVNATDIMSVILIIIILALLAVVVIRSMVSRKETSEEEELSVENLLQSTPESSLEDIEVETKSETRKLIEKFVDENPEAVANLLRNWLNEDWG